VPYVAVISLFFVSIA
jgi:ABC-type multidrug transport system permease subunit